MCGLVLFSVLSYLFHIGQTITVTGNGRPGESCEMGGGVMGVCEEVGACMGSGGVVRRAGQVTLCQPRPPNIYVCCRRPERIAAQLCEAWSQYWRGEEGHCVQDNQLIFGGKDAKPGEFPHIALVGSKDGDTDIKWGCGGSLISPHFVLTAAHCVPIDSLEYWVRLGDYDRRTNRSGEFLPRIQGPLPSPLTRQGLGSTPSSVPLEQLRRGQAIRHPEYKFPFKYHDIALIKLETPVVFTHRVLPACLPTDPAEDHSGRELTVVGWGWTSFAVPRLTWILQKVNVPVVDLLECHRRVEDPKGTAVPRGILPSQICAGAEGRDSCRGDSGGPMVDKVERDGTVCEHTVVGVVSFGQGCGSLGVYSRVSAYLDWIMAYIAPNA